MANYGLLFTSEKSTAYTGGTSPTGLLVTLIRVLMTSKTYCGTIAGGRCGAWRTRCRGSGGFRGFRSNG